MRVLSAQLQGEFGRGFGEKNLRRMGQFAEVYPDREIVAALLRQMGWTHFTMLIPIDDPLFYQRFLNWLDRYGWWEDEQP